MMFACGNVRNAPSETTQLIEDIVRSQVIELVRFFSRMSCDGQGLSDELCRRFKPKGRH